MKINLSKAVKYFFPNPSLEMVYYEAVANSIDAKATNIEILVKLESFSKSDSLYIEIIDNGEGFTDKRFEKFSNLLEVEEEDHKGVGRLVFLNYFKKIDISSTYEGRTRTFALSGIFDGENELAASQDKPNETCLQFKSYSKEKIKSYDYVKPDAIKKALLLHFFPLFYSLKVKKQDLRIAIRLETQEANLNQEFFTDAREIIVSQIPELKKLTFKSDEVDLFEELELHYSIKESQQDTSIITALSVDGRTIQVDLLSKGGIPVGYEIIFILYSNLFQGKTSASRQELNMDECELKVIKKLFREKVAEILNEKIPKIQERNAEVTESLEKRFPHLSGFFEKNNVGLIDRSQSLEIAQKKFFNAQKEILDSCSLTDEQYHKSLEMSSRVLTEYVLYRNIVINKLKKIDGKNSESDIHNIIVPMRTKLERKNFSCDLYTNNAWLLDDKYMSYTTILSDKEMDKVIKGISFEDEAIHKDDKRPDIALVFSSDPLKAKKVDVVIVELKKLDLKLERKHDIVIQLINRATKLLKFYPDKIQRIWFYGIVDIDKEFKLVLKGNGFTELYSNDTVLYKPQDIYLDDDIKIPIGIYIQSFNAFLEDAEVRNSTFLNLLKENLKDRANSEY